jgi:hypothetical protein
MIIVKLQGGLGNQMFQYALGKALAFRNHDSLKLDLTFLLDRTPRKNFVFRGYDLSIFPIKREYTLLSKIARITRIPFLPFAASRFITKLKDRFSLQSFMPERGDGLQGEILKLSGNLYLDGYWQKEGYFKDIEFEIRKDFSFEGSFLPDSEGLAREIVSTNSICLNVRRGDFVTLPRSIEAHGFIGGEYYRKAVEYMSSKTKISKLFVFSDDMEWCRHNLRFDFPTAFVDHEHAGKKFSQYLRLMSLCKHFIIPNSSFAWWAAWLSQNPDKIVVAPEAWFQNKEISDKDLVPKSWVRM